MHCELVVTIGRCHSAREQRYQAALSVINQSIFITPEGSTCRNTQ